MDMLEFLQHPEGQAGWDMANLRPSRTGLPFVVFISQKGGAKHDARVKVAKSAKVIANEMGSYRLRPFGYDDGARLDTKDEMLLKEWISINLESLIKYWDGEIEYTEDMLERLRPLSV